MKRNPHLIWGRRLAVMALLLALGHPFLLLMVPVSWATIEVQLVLLAVEALCWRCAIGERRRAG